MEAQKEFEQNMKTEYNLVNLLIIVHKEVLRWKSFFLSKEMAISVSSHWSK